MYTVFQKQKFKLSQRFLCDYILNDFDQPYGKALHRQKNPATKDAINIPTRSRIGDVKATVHVRAKGEMQDSSTLR